MYWPTPRDGQKGKSPLACIRSWPLKRGLAFVSKSLPIWRKMPLAKERLPGSGMKFPLCVLHVHEEGDSTADSLWTRLLSNLLGIQACFILYHQLSKKYLSCYRQDTFVTNPSISNLFLRADLLPSWNAQAVSVGVAVSPRMLFHSCSRSVYPPHESFWSPSHQCLGTLLVTFFIHLKQFHF